MENLVTKFALVSLLAATQAAWAGPNEDLMKAAMKGNMDTVKAAITAGADVNAHNKKQMTPLLNASHMGHTDVIKYLIEQGADVNAKDKRGRSALTHAAHKGNTDLINFLKKQGAEE